MMSHNQVKRWDETGLRPSCKEHHHIPYYKARKLIQDDNAVDMLNKRAIVLFDCVEKYSWRGRMSGHPGPQTMQLCKIR